MPLTISAQQGLINQYDYFDKQIASLNLSNYYIIKKGEFAYNKSYSNGYPYGAIKRLDFFEQGALSSLYICFSISNINSDYLVRYFDSGKWNKQVKLISGEGARNHGLLNLSPDDFFNISIMIPPSKEEQMKISHFLNLINSKIKYMDEKIEALKKYKEGIVQKLLNSLANSNLISLDQLCQITTGKLDANAQIDKGKYKFFTCAREDFLIDTYAFDTEAILVSGNGEVGLTKHYKGKFNAYQRTYVLYDFTLNPLYLKACIDSQINNVIRKETNKGAMPYIKLSTFAKIKIPMISKEESNNIGTLMVSLDSKINCYERIMVTISKMKSFLLNNLFI